MILNVLNNFIYDRLEGVGFDYPFLENFVMFIPIMIVGIFDGI
jgi:hypothetical protein